MIYAGEAFFDNGRLSWWSNGSGNYRPDPDHAEQAGLPMDRFFTFEAVLKGLHKSTGSKSIFPATRTDETATVIASTGVE